MKFLGVRVPNSVVNAVASVVPKDVARTAIGVFLGLVLFASGCAGLNFACGVYDKYTAPEPTTTNP